MNNKYKKTGAVKQKVSPKSGDVRSKAGLKFDKTTFALIWYGAQKDKIAKGRKNK